MSLTAVIQLNGKQFMVAEKDVLVLDRLPVDAESKLEVTDVLLTTDGEKTQVGQPTVAGAKVVLSIDSHTKDKKITVRTYKAKSRYRKTRGHRQPITTATVQKISLGK